MVIVGALQMNSNIEAIHSLGVGKLIVNFISNQRFCKKLYIRVLVSIRKTVSFTLASTLGLLPHCSLGSAGGSKHLS